MTQTELRSLREEIVGRHLDAENRHDIEATVATFHRARYEVNGEIADGAGPVRDLLDGLLSAFPDLSIELQVIYHADDAVIGEARMAGTHRGTFAGIAATGKRIDYPVVGIFVFDDDKLLCEKVFFDSTTLLRQLGVLPAPA